MHSVIGLLIRLLWTFPVFLFLCGFISCSDALSLTDNDIAAFQQQIRQKSLPDRIAVWAERFVGTPYDRDPLGEYVRRGIIVADERVDCMYHVFRSVELAIALSPEQAIGIALEKRFHDRGVLEGGRVVNYHDRYAYGEDMVQSGKFGREVTREFGSRVSIRVSRGAAAEVFYVPRESVLKSLEKFRNGDILFFVQYAHKRILDEVIGHMGVVVAETSIYGKQELFLVHAAGMKGKGGIVKKVPLRTYLATMPFAGAQITRFE